VKTASSSVAITWWLLLGGHYLVAFLSLNCCTTVCAVVDKDTVAGTKTLKPDVLDPSGDGYSPGTVHGRGAPPAGV